MKTKFCTSLKMCRRPSLIWMQFAFLVCLSTTATALIRSMNQKQLSIIERYMDVNANPCTDFYQYACGSWNTVHVNESYDDTLDRMDVEINQEYERILNTRKQNLFDQHRFVRQVLAYYKSCTTVPGYLPIKYLRKLESYEGLTWPNIERRSRYNRVFLSKRQRDSDSNIENKYWLQMLAILRKYGMNGIFVSENVLPRRNDSSRYIIDIDKPVLTEEFEQLERSTFEMLIEQIGINMGHRLKLLWQSFNRFELKLLELFDIEDTIGYEELSLSDIKIPQLTRYFGIFLNRTQSDVADLQIGIANRAYLHALFNLLGNYEDEFICRYLMVRFLWHLHTDGPSEFFRKGCIINLREELPLAMSWLHEQEHPELLAETETIKRMFEGLRTHFAHILTINPNNFDNEVLQFLSTKLKLMQLKVGNLPRNATVSTMESFHRELTLNENDFYGNHLKILRFLTRKQHARLNSTLPQDALNFYYLENAGSGSTTTPYYLPRHNMVILPLTLLHLPLYHPQVHDVFKYSLIGFLLAHEITHGFDDSSLDYDEKGNMRDDFGELIKSNRIFDGHLECLLAKNPRVIDEKIADVSGLRWAYETYFGNATQATQQLPWAKLTQQQLFFHNFALFFCGNISHEDQLVNSTHGTYRSRLYDTIGQFDEFGRAFNCPAGATMNPKHKCQLW